MADAFMTALNGADSVKATARFKDTKNGVMKTVTLLAVPDDMTEEAFYEASKAGVDLSAKSLDGTDKERSRGKVGKGVWGAAATSATANVLGYTVPAEPTEPTEPTTTTTKNRKKYVMANDPKTANVEVGADGFAK